MATELQMPVKQEKEIQWRWWVSNIFRNDIGKVSMLEKWVISDNG